MSLATEPSSIASRPENRPQRSKGNRKSDSLSGKEDAKMIGQWRIGRTIGKGSSGESTTSEGLVWCRTELSFPSFSGRVKIAKHAVTGKYAAIKIVPKGLILHSRMSMTDAGAKADKILLGIEREIVIMKLIDHPNVLNLYDVWETSGEL
jgi:serine/threonine-protein kinase HSL1 (negative regulator of Swe1 kinase)